MLVEISETLEVVLNGKSSLIARDLKLNLQRLMTDGALDKNESALALLALSTSVELPALVHFARSALKHLDFAEDQINEAAESAAIMSMLNIYYRTKHMLTNGNPSNTETNYKNAGLRMTSLSKPLMGKERFEMLAFAVSVLNGCESCINAHETVLRESNVDPNKIHDLMRMAAVVKGLKSLVTIE